MALAGVFQPGGDRGGAGRLGQRAGICSSDRLNAEGDNVRALSLKAAILQA